MTPLRIQKTSAFRGEQQHNSLHNADTQTLHSLPSAFYHSLSPGKDRCISKIETETTNQNSKNWIITPTKQCLQSATYHWGQQPAHQTQAQPCSAEGTRAMWPLTSLCTPILYKIPAADISAPSSIASASSSLKRGSLCSKAKAWVLPSPVQSLARQLQSIQNKWIFQLWVIPQETEF